MTFFGKHKKEFLTAAIVLLVLIVITIVQKSVTKVKSIEADLKNEPRNETVATDDFYSSQLTELELENFQLLEAHIQKKEGGVISFTEKLTGTEYLRITTALANQSGDYFYGFYDIPMTEDDVCVSYQTSDLTEIEKSTISKVILFISAAEGINEQGSYDDDGTVTNLAELEGGLAVNDPKKLAAVEEKEKETDEAIDNIVAEIPKDTGEKETIDYFLDWMEKNLTLDSSVGSTASITKMEDVFEGAYVYVNTSCVLEEKAAALGYTKLLSELCNRAGMESHIVLGTWGNSGQSACTFTVINLGGEEVYVDASGAYANSLSGERYISRDEVKKHLNFVSYFDF